MDYGIIHLSNTDKVAIVDFNDLEILLKSTWYLTNKGRVATCKCINKKKYTILIHRFILKAPINFHVDHKNHNSLDNRRKNLRLCTRSQNKQNERCVRGKTSKYKGVHYRKPTIKNQAKVGVYVDQIEIDGKKIHLGYFKTETETAITYNKKAIELFKEFACLNII